MRLLLKSIFSFDLESVNAVIERFTKAVDLKPELATGYLFSRDSRRAQQAAARGSSHLRLRIYRYGRCLYRYTVARTARLEFQKAEP